MVKETFRFHVVATSIIPAPSIAENKPATRDNANKNATGDTLSADITKSSDIQNFFDYPFEEHEFLSDI